MDIAGYRFRIKFNNGDTNEWYRETNIISPLYKTKQMALKAFYLYLDRTIDKIGKRYSEHFKFQKQFEKNVDEFRQRMIASKYKEIEETKLLYRSNVTIYPEYICDDANINDVIEFNIAD